MFKNFDGRMDAGLTGILLAQQGAFCSSELKETIQLTRYICKKIVKSSLTDYSLDMVQRESIH